MSFPVSDHIYLSSERATLLAESYRLQSREVEQSAAHLPGSELRERALAIARELEGLARQVQSGRVVPLQRREAGVDTRRKIERYVPNRGHQ